MTTRTVRQLEASRENGTRSSGPLTVAGKATSAMNSLKTGLSAEALLLPHEAVEDYEEVLSCWLESLPPASPAEGRLVARIADIDFKLARVTRLERRLIAVAVDTALAETPVAKAKKAHLEARHVVVSLAALASQTKLSDRPEEAVDALLRSVRILGDQLVEMRLPGPATALLLSIPRQLALDTLLGDRDEIWALLGKVAGDLVLELDEALAGIDKMEETERRRLFEEHALGADREMKKLERHRSALQNELDKVLASLRTVRELAASANGSGSFCGPLRVDLRLVGMSAPANER